MAAAKAIGIRDGWKAVTIRSVATELGYTSPLLYEHFQNKEDLLTGIAADGMDQLKALFTQMPQQDAESNVIGMIRLYWMFLHEHSQLYRLMNGMDGVAIDRNVLNTYALDFCRVVTASVRPLLGTNASDEDAQIVTDELWALLHGMASLYLDRSVPFDAEKAANACMKLIRGDALRT